MPNASAARLLAIGVIGALVAGIWFSRFAVIPLEQVGPEEVGKVFLVLIFVALVIERATEVYVNTSLEPETQPLFREVMKKESKVRTARAALNAERQAPGANKTMITRKETDLDNAIAELKQERKIATPKLSEKKSKTASRTGIVGAVLGVLAAVAGVRTLAPFLPGGEFPANASGFQQGLFGAVDVFLTGALLAGGADALHQIVKRFLQLAGEREEPVG